MACFGNQNISQKVERGTSNTFQIRPSELSPVRRFFLGDYFADQLGLAKGSTFADLFLAASICKTQVDQVCQKYLPGYSKLTWTVNLIAWKLLNIVVKSAEFDSKKKMDPRHLNTQ